MYAQRFIRMLKEHIQNFTKDEKQQVMDNAIGNDGIFIPRPENKCSIISIKEILYVSQPKMGKVIIRTLTNEIEYANSSCDLLKYICDKYENFKYFNNGLIVNIDKMLNYNSYYHKVYFSNGIEIRVTGAAIKNIVQRVLGKRKDLYDDTYIGEKEYIL